MEAKGGEGGGAARMEAKGGEGGGAASHGCGTATDEELLVARFNLASALASSGRFAEARVSMAEAWAARLSKEADDRKNVYRSGAGCFSHAYVEGSRSVDLWVAAAWLVVASLLQLAHPDVDGLRAVVADLRGRPRTGRGPSWRRTRSAPARGTLA
jgi:hypothetical protein